MTRTLLLIISLASFFVHSKEAEDDGPKIVIADYRLPPVMVYVDAPNNFKTEMMNDLRNKLRENPESCAEYADFWFCDGDKLKSARGYRGWDGNGKGLMIGFLCESNNASIPSQKYYGSDLFYRYDCIEVWHPVEDHHVVTFPEHEDDA